VASKTPLNRKKPSAEPGRAAICLNQLGLSGQERGVNKHQDTRPGIHAEKEKHMLMTKTISGVT